MSDGDSFAIQRNSSEYTQRTGVRFRRGESCAGIRLTCLIEGALVRVDLWGEKYYPHHSQEAAKIYPAVNHLPG